MPNYEYRCTRCGHQFEVTHAVGETVERCERCRAPVRRVFSPVGIIFKGSGFHINDYRKTSDSTTGDGKTAGDGKAAAEGKGAGKGKAATPAASGEKTGGDAPATASGTGAGTTRP